MSELTEFIGHVDRRTRPEADVQRAGVETAVLYEAIMDSARTGRPVTIKGIACPS